MLHYTQNLKKAVREKVRNVPDFPKPGVQFKDITPLLKDADLFDKTMSYCSTILKTKGIDKIVCVDARGFIFGSVLANKMSLPLVIARKQGKLPSKTLTNTYSLEYGTSTIEMHVDDIEEDENVLIVDDLLATGGTVTAVSNLVKELGGNVLGFWFLIELSFLKGREKLSTNCKNSVTQIHSLIEY